MTTGWFQQAKSVFGRPEAVPQSYLVACDCGATLSGERTEGVLKPPCPACGQLVFVLPACSYPIPNSLRQRWSGHEELPTLPGTAQKTGKKKGKKSKSVPIEKRTSSKAVGVPWTQRWRDLTTAGRAQLTPLRLVALGVLTMVTLTGYVFYRQARFSRAQESVQSSIDTGLEALGERRFPEASRALQAAATSLDILGRTDGTAQEIRRLARETKVAEELSAEGLPQLLTDLIEEDDKTITARFARRYSGRWLLFDAPLFVAADGERKTSQFAQIDVLLTIRDEPVEVLIDGNPWPSLLSDSSASEPKRVIFAAQLDRLELPTKSRQAFRVWLRDAVLWSEPETLDALEMRSSDAEQAAVVDELLATQRKWLEGHP